MKARYDKRHGARELPDLHPGCTVWIPDLKKRGVVKAKLQEPRSYLIELENGTTLRRSRVQIVPTK
jgi:hypothetical protein